MTPEVITCGDLARLGGAWDALRQHDPRAMVWGEDTLCHCQYRHAADVVDNGGAAPCLDLFIVPLTEKRHVVLCCLCLRYAGDVLRAHDDGVSDNKLYEWFHAQLDEALAYRDQRRKKG